MYCAAPTEITPLVSAQAIVTVEPNSAAEQAGFIVGDVLVSLDGQPVTHPAELTAMLGGETLKISYASRPPTVVLMAGLQGSGKTTTTGKLAKLLQERRKKRVMVVSCDVYLSLIHI